LNAWRSRVDEGSGSGSGGSSEDERFSRGKFEERDVISMSILSILRHFRKYLDKYVFFFSSSRFDDRSRPGDFCAQVSSCERDVPNAGNVDVGDAGGEEGRRVGWMMMMTMDGKRTDDTPRGSQEISWRE
jgi:hypothetical protein